MNYLKKIWFLKRVILNACEFYTYLFFSFFYTFWGERERKRGNFVTILLHFFIFYEKKKRKLFEVEKTEIATNIPAVKFHWRTNGKIMVSCSVFRLQCMFSHLYSTFSRYWHFHYLFFLFSLFFFSRIFIP